MEGNSRKHYIYNRNIQDAILFFILAAALMIYSLVNNYSTANMEWKTSPYLFPVLIAVFIGALSYSLLADGIRQMKAGEEDVKKTAAKWNGVLFTIAASIIYYGIMRIVTFVPATILFLVAMLVYLGERRIWLVGLVSVISSLAIYVIFGMLLNVMLP